MKNKKCTLKHRPKYHFRKLIAYNLTLPRVIFYSAKRKLCIQGYRFLEWEVGQVIYVDCTAWMSVYSIATCRQ